MGADNAYRMENCKRHRYPPEDPMGAWCLLGDLDRFAVISGGFGGFNRSLEVASLPPDSLGNEFIAFSM
jgi:hypothetical protein